MSGNKRTSSVGEDVIKSALWVGLWRWAEPVLGFISMLILARLLLPEDFGVVATAMLVIYFFDTVINFGTDQYLIRMPDPKREDYDTAWMLRLIVVTSFSAIIFVSAGLIADFFDDDRLKSVLQVLAAGNTLRGFVNIGLTEYRRDLRFGKIAFFGISQRLVGFFVTIILAFQLHNYWAMVYGQVALHICQVLLSYRIHPYRPKFCIVGLRKQWDFCKWIVVRNFAGFFQRKGDQFFVAKFFGIEEIGFYYMAIRIAQLPTNNLMAPMVLPIYSGLAKKQDDVQIFTRSVLQVIGATFAIALPAAVLVSVLSEPIVTLVLGENWLQVAPILSVIVFALVSQSISQPLYNIFTLLGRVKLVAALQWFSTIVLITLLLVIVTQDVSLEQLAFARTALQIALLFLYFMLICAVAALPWRRLVKSIYRPVIASIFLWCTAKIIAVVVYSPWLIIILTGLAGGVIYIISLYLLWQLASKPDSGEALLARKSMKLIRRRMP